MAKGDKNEKKSNGATAAPERTTPEAKPEQATAPEPHDDEEVPKIRDEGSRGRHCPCRTRSRLMAADGGRREN